MQRECFLSRRINFLSKPNFSFHLKRKQNFTFQKENPSNFCVLEIKVIFKVHFHLILSKRAFTVRDVLQKWKNRSNLRFNYVKRIFCNNLRFQTLKKWMLILPLEKHLFMEMDFPLSQHQML